MCSNGGRFTQKYHPPWSSTETNPAGGPEKKYHPALLKGETGENSNRVEQISKRTNFWGTPRQDSVFLFLRGCKLLRGIQLSEVFVGSSPQEAKDVPESPKVDQVWRKEFRVCRISVDSF